MPHPTKADLDALHGRDPKKLLFMSFDRNDKRDYPDPSLVPFFEKTGVAAISGHVAAAGYGRQPTIYHLNSAKEGTHDPGAIYRTIVEHVKKYGPLSELMIDGHGETNQIGQTAPLRTRSSPKTDYSAGRARIQSCRQNCLLWMWSVRQSRYQRRPPL